MTEREKNDIDRVRERMIDFYSDDPKRVFHFLKVHDIASLIASKENLAPREQYVRDVACKS